MPTPEEIAEILRKREEIQRSFAPQGPNPVDEAQAAVDAQQGSGNLMQAGANFGAALAGIDPSQSMAAQTERAKMQQLLQQRKDAQARAAKQESIRAALADKMLMANNSAKTGVKPMRGAASESGGTLMVDNQGRVTTPDGKEYTGKVIDTASQRNKTYKQVSENQQAISKERLAEKKRKTKLEEQWKRNLTPKQVEGTTAFDRTLNLMKDIRKMKKNVDTGPYKEIGASIDKWNPLGEGVDPEYAKMRGAVNQSMAAYLKSMSGVAISEAEAKRLATVVPNMSMDDKEFNANLDRFEKELQTARKSYLANLEKSGRTTEAFKKYYGNEEQVSATAESDVPDNEADVDAEIEALKKQLGK